ncbi:MAG TPA: 6-carboxytetrahydropterin synthase [Bacteroidia bacterium]|nr:6-carboxytetrahydropterin synthase [Bacteroidia bacterium]
MTTRSPQSLRVTKTFSFDMAHALYGHDGPCKNIHGHTYHLAVTLLGQILNDDTHPKNGMVIDFSDFKNLVHKNVISVYDHALVLKAGSPHAEINGLSQNFEKLILSAFQPTCENLLLDMVERIQKALPASVHLHALRLQETPSSYAEWFRND